MKHLSDRQLAGFASHEGEHVPDEGEVELHLSRCEECRDRLASLVPAPDWLQSAIAAAAHPPDDLLDRYARDEKSVSRRIVDHIAACSRCSEDVAAVKRFLAIVEPASATSERTTDAPATNPRPGAWLLRLAATMFTARTPILRPVGALSFSDHARPTAWEELEFDDPDLRVNLRVVGDEVRIFLRHATRPAPQLALLEAADRSGEVVWRRFVILSEGWRGGAAGETSAPLALVVGRSLTLGFPGAEHLDTQAVRVLLDAWEAARTDPSLSRAWREWARREAGFCRDADARAMLERSIE